MRSLVLMSALAATLSVAEAAQERYVNARFGYSICVPAGLVGQAESANGDGQRFDAADGATLIVYASHNALEESLADQRASMIARLGSASYQSGGNDWFVVSGRSGETIYYARATLRGGVFTSFEFTYPHAAAARWDAAARELSRCFRAR